MIFWNFPKQLVLKKDTLPQTFEKTNAFKIVKEDNLKTKILTLYLKIILSVAKMFKLYDYLKLGDNIKNKNLLIKISNIN